MLPLKAKACRIRPRFRACGDASGIELVDPVFYEEDTSFDLEDDTVTESHELAVVQWEKVSSSLKPEDFPLKVVFLDKSGSMGFDAVCFDALNVGLKNCLNPTRGATLSFLFAGPGETQILLRRPG